MPTGVCWLAWASLCRDRGFRDRSHKLIAPSSDRCYVTVILWVSPMILRSVETLWVRFASSTTVSGHKTAINSSLSMTLPRF